MLSIELFGVKTNPAKSARNLGVICEVHIMLSRVAGWGRGVWGAHNAEQSGGMGGGVWGAHNADDVSSGVNNEIPQYIRGVGLELILLCLWEARVFIHILVFSISRKEGRLLDSRSHFCLFKKKPLYFKTLIKWRAIFHYFSLVSVCFDSLTCLFL